MSTADLAILVNGTEVLALIGTVGALFYFKRWLFAASPKPQPQAQNGTEAKAKDQPTVPESPLAAVGLKDAG